MKSSREKENRRIARAIWKYIVFNLVDPNEVKQMKRANGLRKDFVDLLSGILNTKEGLAGTSSE